MSIAKNPVHWFEIPVINLSRATAFYESVLGLGLSPVDGGTMKMAWFPKDQNAAGSPGALVQGPGRTPSTSGALVYLLVSDIDKAIANVISGGGQIVTPKASGDYGSIAHFDDSEGNRVALYSNS